MPAYTSAVSPAQVIAVGATGLDKIAATPVILQELRRAYSEAVRDPLIFALAAACFAFPFACAMEQLNIKKIAEERKIKSDLEKSERGEKSGGMAGVTTEDKPVSTEGVVELR